MVASPAFAELPEVVLDSDYKNCVGNDAVPDPNRLAFCGCIRSGMQGWSEDTYMNAAQQAATASKSGANAQAPAQIEDLAKKCLAQVLH